MKNIMLLFVFVILLFGACTEDRFEQIVEIEIPPHEPRLAINAIFLSQQDSLPVLVSNSLGILDTSSFSDIKDASVQLQRGGSPVGAFSYNTRNGYYTSLLSETLGSDNAEYQLIVEQAEYPTATATQRMPKLPVIDKVELEEDGVLDDSGERVDEVTVEINDPAGSKEYYALRAYITARVETSPGDTVVYKNRIYLSSNNPLVFNANVTDLGLLISDGSFDGTTYRLTAYTYEQLPFGQEGIEFEVELISLTEDVFQYARSLSQYYDADGNPFAEPVTVHSNIENGYGIFGLGNVVVQQVLLE